MTKLLTLRRRTTLKVVLNFVVCHFRMRIPLQILFWIAAVGTLAARAIQNERAITAIGNNRRSVLWFAE